MIAVYHPNNLGSQRILWLLEELRLPYDIKFYKRHAQTNVFAEVMTGRASAAAAFQSRVKPRRSARRCPRAAAG
jgi:hypothetical protein